MKLKDWCDLNRKFFTESDFRYLINTNFSFESCFETSTVFLSDENVVFLNRVLDRYRNGEPLAYILGKEEFYGLEFKVNPDVLIPRKETELIVEYCIDLIQSRKFVKVLDLCCGSAVIAITVKKMTAMALNLTAADISEKALAVASENSQKHNQNIRFVASDLYSALEGEKFDLIISNPPYVKTGQIEGSLKFEPIIALDGGFDGLFFIRRILAESLIFLNPSSCLVIEIGYDQRLEVIELASKYGYDIIGWVKDYSQHFRGIVLRLKETKNQ
ncbi:MAG: peptide chain release factor N(5)-glutamine methyltransferase [Candidatus Omnitrophica bacterium]|nr:peptide chain release factor N(5)-glutamine methyltransferase [Candidatus Omnitrophota bacterium]